MKEYSRNSPCFCESRKKYKHCHKDIHPESKFAEIIKTNLIIDKKINDYREKYGNNSPCSKGCLNCCYDDFSISLIEMSLILYEIKKSWTKEEIEELFIRSLSYVDKYKIEKPEMFELLEADGNRDQTIATKQIMKTHGRNSFSCPFLDSELGVCKVYAVRPLVCRVTGNAHTDDGSFSQINENDYKVCELIPNSKELRGKTPNIFKEREYLETEIFDFYDQKTNMKIGFRRYPIFYWMKIFLQKNDDKPEIKLFETDHFNVSSKQADNNLYRYLTSKRK